MSIKSKRVRIKSKRKMKGRSQNNCKAHTKKICNTDIGCSYNKWWRKCKPKIFDSQFPDSLGTDNQTSLKYGILLGNVALYNSFNQFKKTHGSNSNKKYDDYILDFELPGSIDYKNLEDYASSKHRFPNSSYRDNYYEQYLTILDESTMNKSSYKYFINLFKYWVKYLTQTKPTLDLSKITPTNANNVVSDTYWEKRATDNKVSPNLITTNKNKNYFQRNIHRLGRYVDETCKYKLFDKNTVMRTQYKDTKQFIYKKLNESEKLWCKFIKETKKIKYLNTNMINTAIQAIQQAIEDLLKHQSPPPLEYIYSIHMLEYIYILVCKDNKLSNCMENLKGNIVRSDSSGSSGSSGSRSGSSGSRSGSRRSSRRSSRSGSRRSSSGSNVSSVSSGSNVSSISRSGSRSSSVSSGSSGSSVSRSGSRSSRSGSNGDNESEDSDSEESEDEDD
jgi:hypothetical protein